MLQYNTKRVIIKSRLRDNQKTKRKEETKMTMTEKPKSTKLQLRHEISEMVYEVSSFAIDSREALYNHNDKLSNQSKRRVCILANMNGKLQTLEKYIDDIGVYIVFPEVEKTFKEAKLIYDRLTEEVNTIAQ